jgi:sodium-dependent phosphate cotransporter
MSDDPPPAGRRAVALTYATKIGAALLGLFVFILALQLLKKGAGAQGLGWLLHALDVTGVGDTLGFGWLMAYVVLSGSPVAAIALTAYSGGALSAYQAFAMITGSRLGASFIVLFVGFLYYLRGQRRIASVSIGVTALIVTATIYLPALALGLVILSQGWLDGVRVGPSSELNSVISQIYDPIVDLAAHNLPAWLVFVAGIGTLLLAFRIFDQALPEVDPERTGFQRIADLVYRPEMMFLLGMVVTSLTLSVSVSLTVLVPLSIKGYVRRENVTPYIMGANITTFVDTLIAATLLNSPANMAHSPFTIVLVEVISVSMFSAIVLTWFYRPYQRRLERAIEWVLGDQRRLALFLAVILLIPILLLLL